MGPTIKATFPIFIKTMKSFAFVVIVLTIFQVSPSYCKNVTFGDFGIDGVESGQIDIDVGVNVTVNIKVNASGTPIQATIPENNCECNGLLILDGLRNTHVGECLKKDATLQFFCYVDANSGCHDKRESSRSIGSFYSYKACEFMALEDIFLPTIAQKRFQAAKNKARKDQRRVRRQQQQQKSSLNARNAGSRYIQKIYKSL